MLFLLPEPVFHLGVWENLSLLASAEILFPPQPSKSVHSPPSRQGTRQQGLRCPRRTHRKPQVTHPEEIHSHLMLRPTPIGKLKLLPCCLFQADPRQGETERQRKHHRPLCAVVNLWELPWGMAGLAFFAGATSSALDSEKDAVLLGAGV